MPTENRSSTIEQHDHIEGIIDMVSVPREVIEFAAGLKWHGYKSGADQKDDQLQALSKLRAILAKPSPQPHAAPIAWMVGTAFWWTREEAERDAAAMSLPVIGPGPMSVVAPTEQRKGEPVMRLECEKLWGGDGEYAVDFVKPGWLQECRKKGGTFLLYTHADPGDVERLRSVIEQQTNLIASLRAELVESRSIDAIAEPSAPAVSIPDGYCLMPRRLTAENGAKALLLGEFKLEVTRECPECLELDEPAEGCEICDGEGEYVQSHMIPWDQIKFIYSEAVKGLAISLQPRAIL
ncbi:hypothetical protein [Pseudomonas putida]|uniref:hypothetical protein n=1 Tax=Pseudomonas putida TaxID=303 RepID=UPI001E5BCE91|nr:hypothetical protein [Pseudomonas putida]MCE0961759.1 hypothetical protein [Pseudomonas putida]